MEAVVYRRVQGLTDVGADTWLQAVACGFGRYLLHRHEQAPSEQASLGCLETVGLRCIVD